MTLGLQNCTLARAECGEETEKVLKKCNSMDEIRKAATSTNMIQDNWTSSIKPVQELIEKKFKRLSLKDEPVNVMPSIPDNEIDLLSRHLNYLFPDMDLTKLVKSHTRKIQSYQDWLEKHCRQRQYTFQIKKCGDIDCCEALSTPSPCDWLPDPILDESGDHYRPFEEVYGTNTTESDRPTLKMPETPKEKAGKIVPKPRSKVQKTTTHINEIIPDDPLLQGEASLFTAQYARSTVQCVECCKLRVIYGKLKFSQRQEYQLAMLLSEYEYSCGAPLTPPKHPLHGKAVVRMNMDCQSPIETPYYSASLGQREVCYYCGSKDGDQKLREIYRSVLPVCAVCKEKGLTCACFRPYGKKATKD